MAERTATLGGEPDGRARTVADDEAAIEFPAGRVQASEAVALIGRLLDQLAARLGERIVRLAEADPISQGILIATATQIEKQAWMLRAQRS